MEGDGGHERGKGQRRNWTGSLGQCLWRKAPCPRPAAAPARSSAMWSRSATFTPWALTRAVSDVMPSWLRSCRRVRRGCSFALAPPLSSYLPLRLPLFLDYSLESKLPVFTICHHSLPPRPTPPHPTLSVVVSRFWYLPGMMHGLALPRLRVSEETWIPSSGQTKQP